MENTLEERYLVWLYSQVASVKTKNSSRTYWSLIRQLFKKEFVWIIPNDDNRVEDGKDLRFEFLREERVEEVDPDWLDMGCSVLEMLIAVSRILAFQDGGDEQDWFWRMLENLDVDRFNDRQYSTLAETEINEALDTLIWRTYKPNGRGGLFPLRHSHENQQDVEIWYQLNAYLLENE